MKQFLLLKRRRTTKSTSIKHQLATQIPAVEKLKKYHKSWFTDVPTGSLPWTFESSGDQIIRALSQRPRMSIRFRSPHGTVNYIQQEQGKTASLLTWITPPKSSNMVKLRGSIITRKHYDNTKRKQKWNQGNAKPTPCLFVCLFVLFCLNLDLFGPFGPLQDREG